MVGRRGSEGQQRGGKGLGMQKFERTHRPLSCVCPILHSPVPVYRAFGCFQLCVVPSASATGTLRIPSVGQVRVRGVRPQPGSTIF